MGIHQTLASISTPDRVEDPPGHLGVHRWSAHRDARSLFLTANADTIYSWTIVDLTSGPMVVCSHMVTTSSASDKGSRGGSMTTQTGPSEPPEHGTVGMDGMGLPAVARYWWLTALRGLVALALGVAVAVAGRGSARLVTFLALFWLTGGLITLRFALAIRPRPGFRLGLAAAIAAVVGAVLVLVRDWLSGLVDPEAFVGLLGIAAVLTGVLRIFGGFAAEERVGRRWTLGGIVLGTLELALGALLLLTSGVDPDLLVPIVAAWGAVSGILLLAQGLRLRRFARTWRQAPGTPPQDR